MKTNISARIASLDALRGFDMFWIIGGDMVFRALPDVFSNPVTNTIKTQVTHVAWEGFRFYDIIFPLFIFIVGAAIPFAILSRIEKGQKPASVYLHIFKRTAVLILLGLIMNGLLKFDWPNMRWPGILQRIAICYMVASIIVIHTRWRTQLIIFAGILLSYWAMLALVPVPGYGPGVITPEGCLHSYIDQLLLPGRIPATYYGPGDSLGIISTLPSIATALLGVFAGHWLRSDRSQNRKTLGMIYAGIVCLIIGYTWGMVFPVIKNIWTSSYVLVAGGWSLLLLAAFYWIIDVKGFKKWAFFFTVIGLNPILIYFGQRIVDFEKIAEFFFAGIAKYSPSAQILIMAIGVLAIKWLLLHFLYKNKIFLKA